MQRFRGCDDQGCSAEITGTAAASETQAKAGEGNCCACYKSGFRLAFSHRSLTLLARQSSRPTHVQRAQLAVGTTFRFWGSGVRPYQHLLRQMWSGVLGTGGRAVPQLHRNSWRANLAAAQIGSGLFPNKRYPGWTVEHVRRPTLDEANTLVAQKESCEAGLGRTVMGPTTPAAPQAALLAQWERIAEAATTEDLTLQRFDHGRPGLLAALGSTISWWQSLLSRLRVLVLARQTECVGNTHVFPTVFGARPKRDFGTMCTVGYDGSSDSDEEAELHNVWNPLSWRQWCTAAASAHRGGNGQGGAVLSLCMRPSVRGTLRLGRGRARLTATS